MMTLQRYRITMPKILADHIKAPPGTYLPCPACLTEHHDCVVCDNKRRIFVVPDGVKTITASEAVDVAWEIAWKRDVAIAEKLHDKNG